MYLAIAINQIRTKEGKIEPKAACGMAIPVGWRLSEDGQYYIRDRLSAGGLQAEGNRK